MDTAVKQRLLGGIVLVAGAAVLLPLMLDGSGAKLLSRLEPIPKPPVTTPVEQTRPQLNQQQQEAEDQVAEAHPEDPQFYPVSQPNTVETTSTTKTPEQLAAEQAARNRALALLNGTDGASVEEAQAQKLAEDKAEREFKKQQAELASANTIPTTTSNNEALAQQQAQALITQAKADAQAKTEKAAAKKIEAERALAMLESPDAQTQKTAEKILAEKAAKQRTLDAQAKADKLAIEEKAKIEAAKKKEERTKALEKDKLEQAANDKAEKIAADKEKAKEAKLAAEKEQAQAEKLAADKEKIKAEAKKKEEAKAKLALEGKQKELAKEKEQAKEKDKSEAWVVQVASFADRSKADALSGKLAGKGYRARVVKNGEAWKVVVGPELQKEAANGLKGRLSKESSLGVTGAWVTPWKP
ncbi:MAG: SPOR domain-containing protein [Agitococcus sp.]|nr:SPOR domain-containing protein [Agitococcus sp.]